MSKDLYKLLEQIEYRPGLYLGSKSITALCLFLQGYSYALEINNLSTEQHKDFKHFHEWIALKLNYYESTSGWRNMILESQNQDETKALDTFFMYFNQFKNREIENIFHVDLPLESTPEIWKQTDYFDILNNELITTNIHPPSYIRIIEYSDNNGTIIQYYNSENTLREEDFCKNLPTAIQKMQIQLKIQATDWKKEV
jgi:hypothetical protein